MSSNGHWMFLSNHALVLVCLARSTDQPLRKVAATAGITERAVQRIVAELEAGGYLSRERAGRRNRYVLHRDRSLRHPLVANCTIGDFLDAVDARERGSGGEDLDSFAHWRIGEHGSEV